MTFDEGKMQGPETLYHHFFMVFFNELPDWLKKYMDENGFMAFCERGEAGFFIGELPCDIFIVGEQKEFIENVNVDRINEFGPEAVIGEEKFKKIEKNTKRYLPIDKNCDENIMWFENAENKSGVYVYFQEYYKIPVDLSRKFSDEYAKELADDFC